MKRRDPKGQRPAPKPRRTTFERLEARELLDGNGLASFIGSASHVEPSAYVSNALAEEFPIIRLVDPATGASLSDGDTLQLKSYYADSSGDALEPGYGETVYARVIIQNAGDDALEIASATLSEGSRVEFVGGYKSTLAPNEETLITLKWRAVEPEASTLTITTNDPDQPTFELDLSGSIRANTAILPTLSAVSLLCDTGVSDSDAITCNPTITGAVSGNLYGGRVDVEFDLDSDANVDAITQVYVGGSFTFDPSEYSDAFNPPEASASPVTLRYRPAIYNAYGSLVQLGTWQTFSYTLVPAPSAFLTVSNLAVSANYDGDWTQPNAAKLTGIVSGYGKRAIHVKINNQVYTYSTSESTFSAPLPVGFDYGVTTSIQARAGQFDATTQRVIYGAWSSINVTPVPCAVACLALETDDGVSANDNMLVGTLVEVA